jgi:hypothetical protein
MGELEETLTTLDVSHNPLVIPPKMEVNKGTRLMLNWLKKNEKIVCILDCGKYH